MSYSKLADVVRFSPNKSVRKNLIYNPSGKVTDIVIHHMAGNLTVESCGAGFADPCRKASSSYGVGTDGRIACYVDEDDRPWTTGNASIDHRAITIEVANCGKAPDWKVSDQALEATIALCVDICRRHGFRLHFTGDKKGNLHMHKWYQATACPGPYLASQFPKIAEEVNRRLDGVNPNEPHKSYKPTVKEWQLAAIADGYAFPRYGADGVWGEECEAVARVAVVKKRIVYTKKNLTRLVQRFVGENPDGLCGKNTDSAIRACQSSNNLDPIDGAAGVIFYKFMLGV
jgi:hypothetical protein